MAEYIERENALKILEDMRLDYENSDDPIHTLCEDYVDALGTAENKLNMLIAADVRPERHGHVVWRKRHSGGFRTAKCLYEFPDIIKENNIACKHIARLDDRCTVQEPYCSECGKRLGDFISFCGNCGAKMDGNKCE